MTTIKTAQANAKINLTLHVTGQRDDGYHLLDSLVVFAAESDLIHLEPGPDLSISVTGPFATGVPLDDSNLVLRALRAAHWSGHVSIEKNLPHGAGIGSASADAAAVLRMLFGQDVTQGIGLDAALSLGADVPVCHSAAPQRMQGIGERLTPVWPVPRLSLVLVNPGRPVSTPQVFKALKTRDNPAMSDPVGWRDLQTFVAWLAGQRNDMQAAAHSLVAEIAEVLAALEDALLARMSGSGATCFGLYPDDMSAQAAACRIAEDNPDWWVRATFTVGCAPEAR